MEADLNTWPWPVRNYDNRCICVMGNAGGNCSNVRVVYLA